MNFTFEDRWYDKYEIMKKFSIKEKTWKNWLYDNKTGKKRIPADMGIYKLSGTNYYVINPVEFQEWFNNQLKGK
tara:strand:+ start:461 stop:682 length:222 start_codon:yes stop_codon:yes gene_type:complete